MKPALILIALMAAVGLVLYLLDRRHGTNHEDATATDTDTTTEPVTGCTDASCVLHTSCPSEQLLRGACEEKIVYFNDEELDALKGRDPDSYTDDELEQLRDVLYTLRHEEIMPWFQSISRRGIALPADFYRELLELAS